MIDVTQEIEELDETWTLKQKVLAIAALLGVFGAFQIYVHRADISYPWLKLGTVSVFIATCLAFVNRDTLDVFLGCVAGLSSLFALAMFGVSPTTLHWGAWFAGFVAATVIFVL